MKHSGKTAIIIGAGPAGLTAGFELLARTDIKPILLEASGEIGGISRTIRYKGNRMDIGGHRFFSKSDRVMNWWRRQMPVSDDPKSTESVITYQGQRRSIHDSAAVQIPVSGQASGRNGSLGGSSSNVAVEELPGEETVANPDLVMLIRPRKSRIFYLRRFFNYPITMTRQTFENLGIVRTAKVGVSYLYSRLRQIEPEKNLEDFLINRFGRQLYLTFFKSYTEKVWGTPCRDISAEWGAQRIKGLSLTTAITHFLRKTFSRKSPGGSKDIAQKDVDTSLIERFLYPKFGPGQLWEHVANQILNGVAGDYGRQVGEIHMHYRVSAIHCEGSTVKSIEAINDSGESRTFEGDYFFSTMPMRELIEAMDADVPKQIREISDGLQYRDFITVGLLADRLKITEPDGGLLKDTWIYIQEPDVLLGRLQIFNNWSPDLVADSSKVWIGLEYFCYDTDDLWKMNDDALKRFAVAEIAKIGILTPDAVSDSHVVRVPKTYPAYFGTYERFDELRAYTDSVENLFLIGRNGMHKYNNQDHSMLTAMAVVDGLVSGHVDKCALWNINTEQEYHEEKK